MKAYLCNGCNQLVVLDELDDQHCCPYCGSIELEFIEAGAEPEPEPDDSHDGTVWG